ncbi:transcriptional regulator domain-containing protein [Burkholderia lata]|uniref:transcriptional regulator domain-containing protein n=1 Tax=Burkholderia lata (strain ATCC 17760 / DSM 23089 / LMG 22485 / NCIMB 9086 / R18194 / 383) TaxID=482957 RepID=UPI0034A01F6F
MAEWAWEFLRRNRAYQLDFDQWRRALQPPPRSHRWRIPSITRAIPHIPGVISTNTPKNGGASSIKTSAPYRDGKLHVASQCFSRSALGHA